VQQQIVHRRFRAVDAFRLFVMDEEAVALFIEIVAEFVTDGPRLRTVAEGGQVFVAAGRAVCRGQDAAFVSDLGFGTGTALVIACLDASLGATVSLPCGPVGCLQFAAQSRGGGRCGRSGLGNGCGSRGGYGLR